MKTIFEYYSDPSFIAGRIFYPIWLSLGVLFFVFKLGKRNHFPLRLSVWILGIFSISFLVPMETAYVPWNAVLILVGLFVGMHFAFRISWKSAIFFAMTSALLQNLSWHLSNGFTDLILRRDLTMMETVLPFVSWDAGLIFVLSVLVSYSASYFLFIRTVLKKEEPEIKIWKFSLLAVLILIIVYLISNLFTIEGSEESISFRFAMSITCFSLLTALYTTAAVDKYEIDKQVMNSLFSKEQRHYEELVSNMEMMNKRAHDLKYQIQALENHNADSEFISGLKESLKSYESIPKTGNDALDNTLNDKLILCSSKNIGFEFHVNGKELSFMKPVDIYILFGNALDNAIEAAEKQEKEENRIIRMSSYRQGHFLKFHIENPLVHAVTLTKNGIASSKKDSFFHGYGTKSMKEIVNRYHGSLAFSQKEGMFAVDILFSLPD